MKKSALLFVLILGLVLSFSLVQGAPRMTIPETLFDFGYAPQNAKLTHVFWIHSTGDDTLKIIRVKPGWGCTKAPLEKNVLAVGDSTRLEIILHTKRYKNKIIKQPRIESNEGKPDKTVKIQAQIVIQPDSTYPIVISPYKLNISQFGEKVRDEMTFKIENVSDQDVKPIIVDIPDELFEVDIPDKIKAGKTEEAVLKLKEVALDQSFEKTFTIELDDEAKTRFSIPVRRALRLP